jgi:hypothetical protein
MATLENKTFEMEGQNQEGKSERAEAGTKNEKVEWELESKFPPFSLFSFCCFLMCLVFFILRRRQWCNSNALSSSFVEVLQ